MGKRIVIISFLVCLAIAIYQYMFRSETPLREIANLATKRAPVSLEDFVIYRFDKQRQTAKLTARLGQIFEPNRVELAGEIRSQRVRGQDIEFLSAESAIGTFDQEDLLTFSTREPATLRRAEFSSFVEVGVQGYLLSTDYAEFKGKQQLIESSRPVRLEGKKRIVTGDNGFRYNLTSQAIEMNGPIEGSALLD
jgi:hypothetical protein